MTYISRLPSRDELKAITPFDDASGRFPGVIGGPVVAEAVGLPEAAGSDPPQLRLSRAHSPRPVKAAASSSGLGQEDVISA